MDLLIDGEPILGRVILAHGAGAGMQSEFLEELAKYLAGNGVQVVRFEFPYMQQRRIDGKKRPPNRADKLIDAYKEVVEEFSDSVPLFLAGKSMGGRIASMILEDSSALACFVFGYPFHPVGKLLTTRADHMRDLTKPLCVFQGERDPMGTKDEVQQYLLPSAVMLNWLADGNHDLKPRKSSGFTQLEHMRYAMDMMLDNIKKFSHQVAC
ncbi:alpha/beta family hydrolase [Neptunomonas japonica]|uniref:alpha/beta family hydrolase n=1 Tax=Neptunomonas japonica TaxID=417574 RepID=UPI0003F8A1B2|nr:alpha/beta family hydrolase [Neptunomonas japonica]